MFTNIFKHLKQKSLGADHFATRFMKIAWAVLKMWAFQHFENGCLWGPRFWKPCHVVKFENWIFTAVGCCSPTFLRLIFVVFYTENYNLPFTDNSLLPNVFFLLLFFFKSEVMAPFTHSLIQMSDNQNFKTSLTSLKCGRFSWNLLQNVQLSVDLL